MVTRTLARDGGGQVVATLTIANTGGTAAQNVTLSVAKIGTFSGTPLPQSLGTMAAGRFRADHRHVPRHGGSSRRPRQSHFVRKLYWCDVRQQRSHYTTVAYRAQTMTNLRNLLLTVAALAVLPGATARADSLSITFDHSILSAAPGQTVTFRGTITNLENAIVDLNSCDVNLTGPFTTDSCVDFLLFAPLFLGPHETSAPFDMFTVTVDQPFTGPFGLQFPGIFTVLGGPDGDAQNVLAQANLV